ncbi:MAG TPA: glycosyltransferase family 4 protein [Blastocatellia bacterium]|nr:glycosyltransferase family 4 protein [Blastocatellia bacterium]
MTARSYNIAHILPWFGVSGTEHATLRIAQAVAGEGFRSIAFCRSTAAPVLNFFSNAGLETVPWEPETPDLRHFRGFLYRSKQLFQEFIRRKVDLVHCADTQAGFFVVLAARMAGIPLICHVRNRCRGLKTHERNGLRGVDKFAFVSRDTWRSFPFHIPERRGVVIYDGIEVPSESEAEAAADRASVRQEFSIPDHVKIIGMAARVDPQKDYETLARAAARVVAVNPDVRFMVVGPHSIERGQQEHYVKVRQMIEENRVAPWFTFTDFRTDVKRIMNAMDIFVLSTHYEGLPLVILEAMAQSRPVVATAVDGIPEIVCDEQTGLLYPHGDDEQMAAHLLRLLSDEDLAREFGQTGRRLVAERFSREQFADSLVKLYRQMLGTDLVRAKSATG